MDYKPAPVDTSKIDLSDDLLALTERLAENTHEVWARQRMQEGWSHGPQRDDEEKLHPDLRPYSELSESEKQYDRSAAMETIKLLVALGYSIQKQPQAATDYLHTEVTVGAAQVVHVTLEGQAANVLLLDDANFELYESGDVPVEDAGGDYTASPVIRRPSSAGRWNVGVHLGGYREHDPAYLEDVHQQLMQLHKEGKINPLIHSTISLREIPRAIGRLVERATVGKVIAIP